MPDNPDNAPRREPAQSPTGSSGRPLTLVTGATGMIGGRIAELLVKRGDRVRALVRAGSDTRRLDALGVELALGDVTDGESLRRTADGCGLIYHAAALVSPYARRLDTFHTINVEGTRNVLDAAETCGVRRLLHISSIAALGARPGIMADETTQPEGDLPEGYPRSKYLSERLVHERVARGLDAVMVNPAVVVGPGDRYFGRIIEAFLRGRIPALAFPDREVSIVYVDDVARGALLAMENAAPGRRYVLSAPPITIRAFFEELAAASGRKPPRITIPSWLAAAGIAAAWALSPVTRRRPPMMSRSLRTGGSLYDGSLATGELGLTYTCMRSALDTTVAWIRAGKRWGA